MWEWAGAHQLRTSEHHVQGNSVICHCASLKLGFRPFPDIVGISPEYVSAAGRHQGVSHLWKGSHPLAGVRELIGFPGNPFKFTDALSWGAIFSPLKLSGWVTSTVLLVRLVCCKQPQGTLVNYLFWRVRGILEKLWFLCKQLPIMELLSSSQGPFGDAFLGETLGPFEMWPDARGHGTLQGSAIWATVLTPLCAGNCSLVETASLGAFFFRSVLFGHDASYRHSSSVRPHSCKYLCPWVISRALVMSRVGWLLGSQNKLWKAIILQKGFAYMLKCLLK